MNKENYLPYHHHHGCALWYDLSGPKTEKTDRGLKGQGKLADTEGQVSRAITLEEMRGVR